MVIGGWSKEDFAIALGTTLVSIGFSIIAIEIGKGSCSIPPGINQDLTKCKDLMEDLNKTLDELRETLEELKQKE